MTKMLKFLIYPSIALIFFGSIWLISQKFKAPEERLNEIYEQHFKPCLNYWTSDPAYVDSSELSQMAMKYFERAEYSLAIEGFQRFEPRTEDEGYYNLYLGIAYLKTGFDNLAISHLDKSSKAFKDFNNVHLAKWYLSLAYLKAGREKETMPVLNEIVSHNAKQKIQAQQVIQEIDQAKNPFKGFLHLLGF
jgi:tetratricopeptide (TPR) repeat protein